MFCNSLCRKLYTKFYKFLYIYFIVHLLYIYFIVHLLYIYLIVHLLYFAMFKFTFKIIATSLHLRS